MMVKICGITNRDDAMAAVEAGASAIGFNFYRDSPRYVSPTGAAMIAAKIPALVWKVGVFVDETPEAVAKIAVDVGLDVAQLHGFADARGIRVWRAQPADAPVPEQLPEGAEALLHRHAFNRVVGRHGPNLGLVEIRAASMEDHHRGRLGRLQRATSHRGSAALGR